MEIIVVFHIWPTNMLLSIGFFILSHSFIPEIKQKPYLAFLYYDHVGEFYLRVFNLGFSHLYS